MNDAELTYSIPSAGPEPYRPLRFDSTHHPQRRAREIATAALNHICKKNMGSAKWRKHPKFSIDWTDASPESPHKSVEMKFDDLVDHLLRHRKLDAKVLKIPRLKCPWLDTSMELRMGFVFSPNQPTEAPLTMALPTAFGADFPIEPKIDREGRASSSMQTTLDRMFLRVRERLVNDSHLMLQNDGEEDRWMEDLFLYFNAGVALVEHTLHQLYYKAKYDASSRGWTVKSSDLGPPHGQRLVDKLAWIHKITGNPLSNAKDETRGFKRFKAVRNHLNHFDPPVFAASIEDASEWINLTDSIAMLLWKIRTAIGSPLSEPLVKLLLAPRVVWVPRDASKPRTPTANTGYLSASWPRIPGDDE